MFIIHHIDHVLVDRINVALQHRKVIKVDGTVIVVIASKRCVDLNFTRRYQNHLTRLGIDGSDFRICRRIGHREVGGSQCQIGRIECLADLGRKHIVDIFQRDVSLGNRHRFTTRHSDKIRFGHLIVDGIGARVGIGGRGIEVIGAGGCAVCDRRTVRSRHADAVSLSVIAAVITAGRHRHRPRDNSKRILGRRRRIAVERTIFHGSRDGGLSNAHNRHLACRINGGYRRI